MSEKTIDVPSETTALKPYEPQPITTVSPVAPTATTPTQARVDAVANLTFKAYERASMLTLTPEESAALQADFPDDAFRTGAAGKEDLIYIEHAHLRDRLNQVFGLGQWSIIPRNRWAEDYDYYDKYDKTTKKASRIYVEAMLLVRGAFVAEAIGDMVYYPHNQSTNYGDAVEGAKTAALRRCAKEIGVGLQAWKKEFCDAWKSRQRGGNRPAPAPASRVQQQSPRRESAPIPPTPAVNPTDTTGNPSVLQSRPVVATDRTRSWLLGLLKAAPGQENRAIVKEYFTKIGWLMETEELEQLPLRFVATSKAEAGLLAEKVAMFAGGAEAEEAYKPHWEDQKLAPKAEKKAKEPKPAPEPKAEPTDGAGEPWREFEMPFGNHKGTPLAKLEKKYLYGLAMNYQVESEYNGNPKTPEQIAEDQEFRDALDQAAKHYKWELE